MTPKAAEVLNQVESLREIEQKTGMRSQRTQRNLLMTLSDEELAEVAVALRCSENMFTAPVQA